MSPVGSSSRLGPADSIIWRIERDPVLRSTVTVVSVLDRPPDWACYRARLLEASERIAWLRRRIAPATVPLGCPRWVDAPDFDIDDHLRRATLPSPAHLEDALDFAAREAMRAFDPARPLWEFTLLDGVDDGAVLVQKFHHAATDGVGAVRLARWIFDRERAGSEERREPPRRTRPGPEDRGFSDTVRGAAAGVAALGAASLRAGTDPLRSASVALDTVRWGARLLAPVGQPLSPLMRARTTRLRFAALEVDLDDLHQAAIATGGTLNDAFVAAVATGLGLYHEARGHPVTELRMTLPISIRAEGDDGSGNRFVPVRFVLPVLAHEPVRMVSSVSRLVQAWRAGSALPLAASLSVALSALPTPVLTPLFGSLLRNVDFVATNVPGLPGPVYLAGAEVRRQYAFAPPSGAALNVSLLSHGPWCCIGVNMDAGAVDEPELLVASLRRGFAQILATAGPREG